MVLTSSSVLTCPGVAVLCNGIACSIFHFLGHWAVWIILLKISVAGPAQRKGNSCISFLGISPKTEEFGFFILSIFLYTSCWLRVGLSLQVMPSRIFCLRDGWKLFISKGATVWLMAEKCFANLSAASCGPSLTVGRDIYFLPVIPVYLVFS